MGTEIEVAHEDITPNLWLKIAYDMASEENEPASATAPTITWLAEKYDIKPKEALGIITHPKFSKFIHEMQVAIARVNFDRKAYGILEEIMDDGDNRERIASIKVAAELLGYKAGGGININLSFDANVRKADMGEGEVIEAEVFPGF